MNSIEKQKRLLIILSICSLVGSLLCLVFGVLLLIKGILAIPEASGIIKTVFGSMLVLLFFALVTFGIRWLWVGLSLKATKGSIKEGNIAKDGGTVNMRKCDKCGPELKEGETVCSNCGKEF